MKKLLNNLLQAEHEANVAEAAWDQEPDNMELEKRFDQAYDREYNAREALVAGIVKAGAGMITAQQARLIIFKKRAELENLIARLA